MNVFTMKSIFPVERFYFWVYCFNVGVVIILNQTLIRRRVPLPAIMFSWLVKFGPWGRWWKNVSRLIDYLMKSVKEGNWFEPCSFNIVDITRPKTEDLALRSPVNNSKWGLKLVRCTMSCSKILIKWYQHLFF